MMKAAEETNKNKKKCQSQVELELQLQLCLLALLVRGIFFFLHHGVEDIHLEVFQPTQSISSVSQEENEKDKITTYKHTTSFTVSIQALFKL